MPWKGGAWGHLHPSNQYGISFLITLWYEFCPPPKHIHTHTHTPTHPHTHGGTQKTHHTHTRPCLLLAPPHPLIFEILVPPLRSDWNLNIAASQLFKEWYLIEKCRMKLKFNLFLYMWAVHAFPWARSKADVGGKRPAANRNNHFYSLVFYHKKAPILFLTVCTKMGNHVEL